MVECYKNLSLENIVEEIEGIVYTEEWKIFPASPSYQVSSFGRVKTFKRLKPKILKPAHHRRGYLVVGIRINGESKSIKVHRLVGVCFLTKQLGLNEINHKDLNKHNNFYKNIEWSNRSMNMAHAIKNGAQRRDNEHNGKARILLHQEYGVFCTLRQAARMEGVSESNLWMQIKQYKANGRNTCRKNKSKFIYA